MIDDRDPSSVLASLDYAIEKATANFEHYRALARVQKSTLGSFRRQRDDLLAKTSVPRTLREKIEAYKAERDGVVVV